MIQNATSIHSDMGYTKADKPHKNETKKRINKKLNLNKKGIKSNFGYKLHSIHKTGIMS